MTHLQESLLIAVRDGAVDPPTEALARAHLATCPSCAGDLAALEKRGSDVAAALETLDGFFDAASARASVRVRVARAAADAVGSLALEADGRLASGKLSVRSVSRRFRARWIRAAGAVLFLAAASAAAALPGSPLRRWAGDLIEGVTPGPAAVERPSPAAASPEETTGVRIGVSEGPLQVLLRGVPADGEVEVRWVSGTEAAVFGPLGSRFTSARGRIEAILTPGRVRVELPRSVVPTSLVVDGRIYLSRTPEGLTVPGPAIREDESGIVFRGGDR
ncbi:MAG: zf-HC2 domain-containing protein [Gemmatimonadetes bacterium]|nr:zf-HC2 domain-containing protein [Gemmatimonadota bacterium]